MYAHAFGLGEFRGFQRIEHAGSVDAIGEQHHHALALLLFAQALDRQCDRIANRGFAPGQAHHAIAQLIAHGSQIGGQRCQRIRTLAEHQQADAVAVAPIQKVRQHGLGGSEPVHHLAAEHHVRLVHAPRQIHRQHHLAGLARRLDHLAQLLRTRQRSAQQKPPQPCQPTRHPQRRCGFRLRYRLQLLRIWHA